MKFIIEIMIDSTRQSEECGAIFIFVLLCRKTHTNSLKKVFGMHVVQ